ncbi:MAG: class I tRNA ligase family protein [Gemmataceae bacterium]
MPFEKVETSVDFPAQERAMLQLWDAIGAFEQLLAKNKNGPRWSFLDGPITANNPMGVHHAWGRTYKDAYQRFHAMLGQQQRYQNGFDCQGLWVEVEVEKQLRLQSKRDIENLVPGDRDASIAKFVQLCKDRVDEFARVQTNQSIRLGYWMDWDRTDADWAKPAGQRKSYFTMAEENNYTIWAFLKKCHHKGLLYRGYDAMPWCGRCGVGISEQEIKEGYKDVEHRAVFVKFPLLDRPGENLLVWTTTPWTLTSNVGAAVNPELIYLRVKLKDEVYYVARGAFKLNRMESSSDEGGESAGKKGKRAWIDGVPHLKSIEQIFKEKAGKDGFEILGEVRGQDLLGLRYAGPFDDLPAQQHPGGFPELVARAALEQKWAGPITAAAAHRVISGGADVTEGEGTGIVHSAPGCGQIDFTWGKETGLPPVAPLDEAGCFVEGFGPLTGKNAVDPATADAVFEHLKATGRLFALERYVHRYPHCWRCKTELLYRLVDEWFIHMGPRNTEEGFRGAIMKIVDQVTFLPESISGRARERDWLWNMGDWMISKKRFWGLALPIWVDEVTGDFEVIGGYDELKARAVEGWEYFEGHTPHRPHLDRVKIRNPKTGNLMSRIPDVGNPWLDAGIVPYSTMGYNRDRAEWEKWFPADLITECFPGQFRNWFYAILAMSTMMENRPPFKVLLGHGLVRDQNGEEMHKSKGNAIEFNGAADSGYELFVERNPKLTPEAQAKLGAARGGLPEGYIALQEGEKIFEGKPVLALIGKYRPIGADVIRWLYCRQAPASNVNLGPGPADEIRARFHLKLLNVYAFFCNYARLDGFDPCTPVVPVAQRPDIDRWILSDLQRLIQLARDAFERFDIQAFCLEVERFVDDKLSNWYVRRNRRRFWKGEQGQDKQAAYQTLYQVLVTLARLLAPVQPFFSEAMHQNLVVKGAGGGPASIHLCDYPAVDVSLVDEKLSADMESLLRLVSLGSAARNAVKIKVRQPLAELKVQPANEADRRAIERFGDQLVEELNVKRVSLHEGAALLTQEVKANPKTLGPKLGAHLKACLPKHDTVEAASQLLASLPLKLTRPDGVEVELVREDFFITTRGAEGWSGVLDRGTQVAIDARITPELAAEGMARDVIRQVQELRKQSGLEMEDRITLYLATASDLLQTAIEAHREYIAGETLTSAWANSLQGKSVHVKVEGNELTIALQKA